MNSLVVYDSYFGNTEKVAQTIYETLKSSGSSKLIHVSEASDLDIEDYDLIVVGSPTRYYKPTKPIVQFVREIKSYDIRIGLFDTRMDAEGHWILGPAERILGFAVDTMDSIVSMGQAQMDVEPLGVYVKSTEGPIAKKSFKDIEAWTNLLIQAMPKTTKAKPKAKPKAKAPKAVAKPKPAVNPVAKKATKKPVTTKATPKVEAKPVAKKASTKTAKPASVKPSPKTKSTKNEAPVYAVDLSTGKQIDLTQMTVAQLKQFAKDNFNKGYEDLNREQLIMLNGKSAIEVKEMARLKNVKNYSKMRKSDLVKILTSSK
jgi:sulfite reductase alpha subunit-like flavoprotein